MCECARIHTLPFSRSLLTVSLTRSPSPRLPSLPALSQVQAAATALVTTAIKKRGRPPKKSASPKKPAPSASAPKKRGRPPKNKDCRTDNWGVPVGGEEREG